MRLVTFMHFRAFRGPKLLLIPLLLLILVAWGVYAWLFVDLPSLDALGHNLAAPSTRLYDRHGRLLYEIADPWAGRHTVVPLERIPLALRQATVATEDASFYTNPGVDLRGILRAIWINLQGGEVRSGGSTITQQVARNLLLDPQQRQERTLTRKLRETILAWRLARAFSKDEILTLYLNQMYYGHLAFGVEAAARAYFGKPVEQLDLAESALLAGLPQSPAAYDPLTNPEAARARQATVLDLMVKQGYITEEEARLAKAEKLQFAATPFPIEAPHFVMYVWSLLEREYGETLYRQGLVVTTTLDLDWQRAAEAIARRHLARLKEERPASNVSDAALVALDPHTGEILAMLGSPDYFDARISGAINMVLAPRQPGSAIKPITYAAAFSGENPWTPATMILDVRTSFPTREGTPYVPENHDRRYHGPVLVREALASSYNIPAVKALEYVGLERMVQLASALGISTFTDISRFGLALTLGGGEVRLLELTAAYAAFANGGYRVQPTAILSVTTNDGRHDTDDDTDTRVVSGLSSVVRRSSSPVLDPRVAYLITDILSDDDARAPTFGHNSVLKLSRPAAAKTGTTTDWRDNWTIGYTPDLVVGVWVGNADNSPMYDVTGISGAGPIWHDFMEQVLKGRPPLRFTEPPGLVRVEVCALSGLLPTPYCPHRRTELFIAGTQPTWADTFYRPIQIDLATGLPAGPDTPSERRATRIALILPPEARQWARENGQWPVIDDPAEINGTGVTALRPLWLSSPDPGAILRISPVLPRSDQRIAVEAQASIRLAQVTLLADREILAEFTGPPYRTLWALAPGVHTFQAIGKDAQGQTVISVPVTIEVR